MTGPNGRNPVGDESIGDLTRRLSEQTKLLVQQEVELAKAELTEKGKKIGVGAGAFGAAGVVALFAVGALVATAILLLDEAVTSWLAALIVGVVLAAIAGILALTGKKSVEAGSPPLPERAIETSREDIQVAKDRAKEGRA